MPSNNVISLHPGAPHAAAAEMSALPDTPPACAAAREGLYIDRLARTASFKGNALPLVGRAFDLLVVLAAEPGRVFTARELFAAVWPGCFVEETNLRVQIAKLRKCLGADAVKNLPTQGYVLTLQACLAAASIAARQPLDVSTGATRPAVDNLPRWQDELLGRQREAHELCDLVVAHRLVSVLGSGGIGKTRLALHVARNAASGFARGVCWVDLALIQPGPGAMEGLCQAIAQATGHEAGVLRGERAPQFLASALAHDALLLLLDNAEHLRDVLVPLLRTLLAGTTGLHVLVTSQQALRLSEEHAYWLGTLALPDPHSAPEQIVASPALQLLVRRAQGFDQSFRLADTDLPAAARILVALDGIALAIEMAAARLPLMGVATLEKRLTDRLRLLGGDADAPLPRHRTLRATLDWSQDMLTDSEKAALRRLSVFVAPFCLETACKVAAVGDAEAVSTVDAIQGLIDKSMIQLQPAQGPGLPRRLRLLESTRLYAREALARSNVRGEMALAQQLHAQAMAERAVQARDDYYALSDSDWLLRWLPDYDDWMAVFDEAYARDDAKTAAPIIELLVLGANITNNVRPALQRLGACRDLAERAPPFERALLLGWGSRVFVPGQSRIEVSARRVQGWRDLGDPQRLCVALAMQSIVLQESGDRAAAEAAWAECAALEQPHWSPRLRWRCRWIAMKTLVVHQPTPAGLQELARLTRRLISELGEQGAVSEMTSLQGHLATIVSLQGQPEEAVALLERTIEALVRLGCHLDAGHNLIRKAALLVEMYDGASLQSVDWPHLIDCVRQGLERMQPDPTGLRRFTGSLALLACHLGDPETAAVLLAGGARLQHDETRHEIDAMQSRAKLRAQQLIAQELGAQALANQIARAPTADAEQLRQFTLAWLKRCVPGR